MSALRHKNTITNVFVYNYSWKFIFYCSLLFFFLFVHSLRSALNVAHATNRRDPFEMHLHIHITSDSVEMNEQKKNEEATTRFKRNSILFSFAHFNECTLADSEKKKRKMHQPDIKCGRPSEKLLLRPVITLASIDFMLIATQIPHMQHLFLRIHIRSLVPRHASLVFKCLMLDFKVIERKKGDHSKVIFLIQWNVFPTRHNIVWDIDFISSSPIIIIIINFNCVIHQISMQIGCLFGLHRFAFKNKTTICANSSSNGRKLQWEWNKSQRISVA